MRGVEGKGEEGFRITGETLERACQEGEVWNFIFFVFTFFIFIYCPHQHCSI